MDRLKLSVASLILLLSLGLSAGFAPPAEARSARGHDVSRQLGTYDRVASGLQQTTGMAISPVLVMFAHGLLTYATAPEGAELPWYASPGFLSFLGAFLLLILGKDAILPDPLKSTLSAVEEAVMPVGALVGLAVVIPPLMDGLAPLLRDAAAALQPLFQTGVAYAQDGAAAAPPDPAWITAASGVLASICGTALYAAVWFVSNTVNVLCIVAPGVAVPVLKSFRLAVVGLLYSLAAIHPLLGLAATLLVIFLSLLVFRWSFRFTVWGFLLTFDLLGRRWRKRPVGDRVPAFGGSGARRALGVPKRTLGWLSLSEGALVFRYRRFLLFPVTRTLRPEEATVGRCLAWPVLLRRDAGGRPRELFTFPLRLRGHEDFLARTLGADGVRDAGLRKHAGGAWAWIRGLWKGRETGECAPA